MDDSKSSRIEARHECDGFNTEAWPEIIEWAGKTADRLELAIHENFLEALRALKTEGPVS